MYFRVRATPDHCVLACPSGELSVFWCVQYTGRLHLLHIWEQLNAFWSAHHTKRRTNKMKITNIRVHAGTHTHTRAQRHTCTHIHAYTVTDVHTHKEAHRCAGTHTRKHSRTSTRTRARAGAPRTHARTYWRRVRTTGDLFLAIIIIIVCNVRSRREQTTAQILGLVSSPHVFG